MYKLTIEFGFLVDETCTIETHDFEKIQIIQEFLQFQEEHGWAVDYEAIDDDLDEDEDTEEEEVIPTALVSDNTL